jgi:trehalose/maltose hydrolase-like predicted phosphorylase
MVTNGLFGMKFNEKSVSFTPFLPEEIGSIELKDLAYRDSKLNILVKGKGNTIVSFTIDGKEKTNYSITSTIKGQHSIVIILK